MKLLAIDGNSILNRAFFGVRLLTNREGVYTNAIFGFLNILLRLEREQKPDATAIAFDVSRKTFRNEQFADYKANRKGMPEELAVQLPLVKEVLTDMGYRLATCEGFEGDDVLGTLAARCRREGDSCVVATGDRDCLQLVDEGTSVCLIKTRENILYRPETVREEYGFEPARIVDMKALMGDTSDNIPGVKGIGEKTALGLLQKNDTLEEIYERLDAGTLEASPRLRQLLHDGRESACLSKQLATIRLDVPIDTDIDDYEKQPPKNAALAELLTRLELFTILERLGLSPAAAPRGDAPAESAACAVISTNAGKLAAVALKTAPAAAVLLTPEGGLALNLGGTVYQTAPEERDELLRALAAAGLPLRTFRAKPLYKLALALGIELQIGFDAELAAYLLNPSGRGYDLPALRDRYLPGVTFEVPEEAVDIAALPRLAETMRRALDTRETHRPAEARPADGGNPDSDAAPDSDSAPDSDAAPDSAPDASGAAGQGMGRLFDEIEMPLCRVLADMEAAGFAVDRAGVERFGGRLDRDIALAQEEIIRQAGEEFNLNSTRELGHILFEKLGLPAEKKTKTGYSTDIGVLEALAPAHPIVPQIIEYRKLTKLYSTYVVGLLNAVAEDGRVHSTFNQTETRTGRISSAEPNVQNIPVRTELGSEMRRFFIAREGYTLVDADYSQIELRILAHIADDRTMLDAFRQGADIHAITAAQVFGYPPDQVPHELRSRAKAINFGIVYGIGAFSLSKSINVSVHEAKEYIDAYLRTYAGVAAYQRDIVEQARRDGYVATIYGRRRDLADIRATNKNIRAFAERVALNTPVQGTAADIIKLAMNRVYARLRREGLDARLILQVHDELIVEARDDQAGAVCALLREEMEGAAELRAPLAAEVHAGKTWYDAKA